MIAKIINSKDFIQIFRWTLLYYLGLLITGLMGYRTTLTISIISVLIIYSAGSLGESGLRKYIKHRIKSQIVGISVAIIVMMIIHNIETIPVIQRIPLSTAIGVLIVMLLDYKFKLFQQRFTPTVCVLVFNVTANSAIYYPYYPIIRIVLQSLSALIGYLVIRYVFPVNYYIISLKNIEKNSLFLLNTAKVVVENPEKCDISLEELTAIKTNIMSTYANIINIESDKNLKFYKRYDNCKFTTDYLNEYNKALEELLDFFILYLHNFSDFSKLSIDFKNYFINKLNILIDINYKLFNLFKYDDSIFIEYVDTYYIPIQIDTEILLLGKIINYEKILNKCILHVNINKLVDQVN